MVTQAWLDNHFYGQIASLRYHTPTTNLLLGGGWNVYRGNHFGRVVWAEKGYVDPSSNYYFNNALKKEASFYIKAQQALDKRWSVFAEMQYRTVNYTINGFDANPSLYVSVDYQFWNPKLGVTYSKNGWTIFGSYSKGSKEPNRSDFESNIQDRAQPEYLNDFELGLEKKTNRYNVALTYYYMYYNNQLVNTGRYNSAGVNTRQNVRSSYRSGIEWVGQYRLSSCLTLQSNAAWSMNKIQHYTLYVYDANNQVQTQQFANTDISFSPSAVGGASLEYEPIKNWMLDYTVKWVGRQFLDNTQNPYSALQPYTTADFKIRYTVSKKIISKCVLFFWVNNIFNSLYVANGWSESSWIGSAVQTTPYFLPMAGRNYMIGLNISF